MFLIALRLVIVLAIAYLFGLLVAWLASLFKDRGVDDEHSPVSAASSDLKENKKRSILIDESYYLEEFDIYKKK